MRRSWKTVVAVTLMAVAPAWANSGRVLVQPFTEAVDQSAPAQPQQAQPQQQPDWINRALMQSVSDDLAGIKGLTVISANPAATTTPVPPDYIVSGTIQRLNGELRVTGHVEDNSTHQIVGGFKATGAERDLFAIEDAISGQLKQIIAPQAPGYGQPQPSQPATTSGNPFAPQAGSEYQGSDLQRALEERDYLRRLAASTPQYQPPDYNYTQPVYPADYGYGYNAPTWGYGYGYPYSWWGGGSVVIINGNRRHDGHHWNGHGWEREDNGSFVPNPGGSPTQSISGNGQRIRAVSSYGGVGNAPAGTVLTPSSSPQFVPTRGVQLTPNSAPQLVPTRSPQLVPSGGPQNVPSGGPQNVPGPTGGSRR